MKKVRVEDASGLVLAHDITEIIPGKKKDAAFRRGHIIAPGDLERLLDLGKRYVYVFEGEEEGIHEDEASIRIAGALKRRHMELVPPKEGKTSIRSTVDGLFFVDERRLFQVNRIPNILLSTVPNRFPVRAGDIVAATRIIPLYIAEKELQKVERIAAKGIFRIRPFRSMKAGLVVTGSEVFSGRVADGSSAVVEKLKGYGLGVMEKSVVPDDIDAIAGAIKGFFSRGAEVVITTAGLSVDPDDVTREGIEATGAEVLFYGAPVFPGAMFLVARLEGKYILGAPACVYYNRNTALDVVLPRVLAGEKIHNRDMVKLSFGGLCLQCDVCHYPRCFFGKGPG